MQNFLRNTLLSIPFGVTFVDVFGYVARVDGESMKPTLNPNVNDSEYVFLNKVFKNKMNTKNTKLKLFFNVLCSIRPKIT